MSCGGDEEDRTLDPLRARQVLSQLSYTPINILPVNVSGFFFFKGSLYRAFKIEQQLHTFRFPLLTGVMNILLSVSP